MTKRADEEAWTPYGLEGLRQGALRRRRIVTLALAGVLLVGYFGMTETVRDDELEVFGNGQKQQLELEIPKESQEKQGPDARIQVSPGRVINAGAGSYQEPQQGQQQRQAQAPPGEPVDWLAWLAFLGPFVLVGTLAWAAVRPRATPTDEVNFGIYKGAMPLEMITASHAHLVVTQKRAKTSLFGKGRADHVPPTGAGERAGND